MNHKNDKNCQLPATVTPVVSPMGGTFSSGGLLIDWITARVPIDEFSEKDRQSLMLLSDRICRFCPVTGDVRYETSAWDSVRSDSHQVVFRLGGAEFWVQGSPARCIGDGCTVFSSGPSASLDIVSSLRRMLSHLASEFQIDFLSIPIERWKVSRIDVTGNLALQSLSDVRVALGYLRNVEGGRYRVSQQAGDTVYWSKSSSLRSAKAYSKGPHLRYLMRRPDYTGFEYTPAHFDKADRLLRLELTLRRHFFYTHNWLNVQPVDLKNIWHDFFDRMIGSMEVNDMDELKNRILQVAPTEGQAKAAMAFLGYIKAYGWQSARENYPKSSFYRNSKLLRRAGLSDADISMGDVVPFRRVITSSLVSSWAEIDEVKYG